MLLGLRSIQKLAATPKAFRSRVAALWLSDGNDMKWWWTQSNANSSLPTQCLLTANWQGIWCFCGNFGYDDRQDISKNQ